MEQKPNHVTTIWWHRKLTKWQCNALCHWSQREDILGYFYGNTKIPHITIIFSCRRYTDKNIKLIIHWEMCFHYYWIFCVRSTKQEMLFSLFFYKLPWVHQNKMEDSPQAFRTWQLQVTNQIRWGNWNPVWNEAGLSSNQNQI